MKWFLLSSLLVGAAWLVPHRIGIPVVPDATPSVPLRLAVIGIWQEGGLESKGLLALKEDIIAKVRGFAQTSWQDAFSLSKEGRVYPKHSVLLVFITLPFYVFMGELAFTIVPLLIAAILLFSTVALVVSFNPSMPPLIVLVLCTLGTQTFWGMHHYFFSYDLLEPMLLVTGLLLSIRFPFLGMMLAPLAALARPSAILLVPFIFLVRFMIPGACARVVRVWALLGLLAGLLLVAILNYQLWGGVLTTAYHRVPLINPDGSFGEFYHPFGFSLSELITALPIKLFGSTHGLITWNLSLALLPASLLMVWRSAKLEVVVPLMLSVIAYLLYGLSYEAWQGSFRGNRLFLSATYLHIIAFSVLCARQQRSDVKRS